MTNPNNAVGTPAAFSGRTSVKAYNALVDDYSPGIIRGWSCSPVTGFTVAVGGVAGYPDVAAAEDSNRRMTLVTNISEAPIEVTLASAPTTYPRIDAVVAYVEPTPTGDGSTQDNPGACGIIPVAGTAAATPDDPTDAQIRAAITTDGGSGTDAYYVVLARIERTVGQTSIASGNILKTRVSKPECASFTRLTGLSGGDRTINTTHTVIGNWAYDWYKDYNLIPDKANGKLAINHWDAWGVIAFRAIFLSASTEMDITVEIYDDGTSVAKAMAHTAAGKYGTIQICEPINLSAGHSYTVSVYTSTGTAKIAAGSTATRFSIISFRG